MVENTFAFSMFSTSNVELPPPPSRNS